jgi:hypothetical protein
MSVRLVLMDPIDNTENRSVILLEMVFYLVGYLLEYAEHGI